MSSRLKLAGIVLLGSFALAACGGGGGGTADTTPTGPTQAEQIAMLQGQIDALRTQLGLGPDDDLSGGVTELQNELADLQQQVQDRQDALDAAAVKANSALANALKAAIEIAKVGTDGTTAVPNTGTGAITPTSIPVLDADGEAGTDETTEADTVAITLKKGDAVGSLGSWSGTDYAGEEGAVGAKNTGMVRAYTNEGASKGVSFTSEAGADIHSLALNTGSTPDDDYTVPLDTPNSNIKSASFPTTGQRTYTGDGTKFAGTYMGAPGTFECTGATACTATINAAGAITLAGTAWNFTPNAGAMLQQRDASYLRFGWWVRKDKDGDPTHAGVFYGGDAGATPLTALAAAAINNADLIGKATYVGRAAGKFAVSDPLRPASDTSGHFTANAELTADFKGAGGDASTLTGTIDAFRLNDGSDDPNWSVALRQGEFGTGDQFTGTTVWSIGDAKAAASGSWEAQMFNDKPDDGSNVPQSTVGSFRSDFGSTHSMVGAFGAEKQ